MRISVPDGHLRLDEFCVQVRARLAEPEPLSLNEENSAPLLADEQTRINPVWLTHLPEGHDPFEWAAIQRYLETPEGKISEAIKSGEIKIWIYHAPTSGFHKVVLDTWADVRVSLYHSLVGGFLYRADQLDNEVQYLFVRDVETKAWLAIAIASDKIIPSERVVSYKHHQYKRVMRERAKSALAKIFPTGWCEGKTATELHHLVGKEIGKDCPSRDTVSRAWEELRLDAN